MLKNETLSNNKVIFYLGLIILGGIIFRFSFAHFDLQLHGDNMQYFLNALDRSLGVEENLFPMHNPGWSSFLSFFFWVFKTENFLELMIIQKIISITISSLTVIPIYFLAKNFFPKKFSIIAGLVFIFEPRIIQNSTFGLTEPLYIIMITIAMVLILSSKKNSEIIAFMILGLSVIVRSEGLFLIPAFVLIYFLKNKISKKSISKITVSVVLISILIIGISTINNNSEAGIVTRINSGLKEINDSPETRIAGNSLNLLGAGIVNLIKFLAWLMIPGWIMFVPIGFILLLKRYTIDTKILITIIGLIIAPTIYVFSFSNDVRFLLPLSPLLAVISLYFIYKISEKINFKLLLTTICIIVIITSLIFMYYKDIDYQNEEEMLELVRDFPQDIKRINYFGIETELFKNISMEKLSFPTSSKIILDNTVESISFSGIIDLESYLQVAKEKNLSHLIIRDSNDYSFLDEIYFNEDKFDFLKKVYDSSQNGFNIHVKIFKIVD